MLAYTIYSVLAVVSMFAATVGIIKPFIANSRRVHYMVAWIIMFFAWPIGLLAFPEEVLKQVELENKQREEQEEKELASREEADKAENAEKEFWEQKAKETAWIRISQDAVRSTLKDPSSAEFRNAQFYSGGGVPVTCGEVNAKNSFGGYTGFQGFIAAGDSLTVLQSEMHNDAEFGKLWKQFCK